MKIILVTDTHLSPRAQALGENWAVARAWIACQDADLAIHLGDITADGVDHPEELPAAQPQFDGLGIVMRFLPGNHDIGEQPLGVGLAAEHPFDPQRLRQYHAAFGADYWSFTAGGWLCVGLNAQLLGTDGEAEAEQAQWLAQLLPKGEAPIALFLHKPLFRQDWEDREIHARYIPLAARQALRAILPPQRLRLVVSGHTHQARRLEHEGVSHVWVPSTSFCIPDAIQERLGEKIVGLAMLELAPDGSFELDFVQPPGMIRHNLMEYDALYPQLLALDPGLRWSPF